MPRIFDNIDQALLPAFRETLVLSDRADFCVGYFNLRGWKQIDELIDRWAGGPGHCCRLLVGMQRLPQQELHDALNVLHTDGIDNQKAARFRKQLAKEFQDQLMLGVPTDADEAGLRRLAAQLRSKKVVVKLFLRHPLHAKLYLLFRPDPISPRVGYLGSSNLTFAGLAKQGELNIDVVDHDACQKLAKWFEERWEDRWCIDISRGAAGDHRGKLGAGNAALAVPHLSENGLPPFPRGPHRAGGVSHPARLREQAVRVSRSLPSRSRRTTSTSAAAC